jgi:metal-responsive CopG/Arc/MetJ family transcriptional regulator
MRDAAVPITCTLPTGLLARLDEVRAVRQRRSTRAVSRSQIIREIVEQALAAPMALPTAGAVRVRVRKPAA